MLYRQNNSTSSWAGDRVAWPAQFWYSQSKRQHQLRVWNGGWRSLLTWLWIVPMRPWSSGQHRVTCRSCPYKLLCSQCTVDMTNAMIQELLLRRRKRGLPFGLTLLHFGYYTPLWRKCLCDVNADSSRHATSQRSTRRNSKVRFAENKESILIDIAVWLIWRSLFNLRGDLCLPVDMTYNDIDALSAPMSATVLWWGQRQIAMIA